MTLDQGIAIAASLAAAASAFATFLTVRQMTKQRAASYRPDLMFSSKSFSVTSSDSNKSSPPTVWKVGKKSGEMEPPHEFSLELLNVGLGVAKHVRIDWDFSIEQAISQLNALAQKALTGAYIELSRGTVTIKGANLGYSAHMWDNQKQTKLDYVLAAATSSTPSRVSPPPVYSALFALNTYFYSEIKDKKEFQPFPPLVARVIYEDVAGVEVRTEIELIFNIMSFNSNEINGLVVPKVLKSRSFLMALTSKIGEIAPDVTRGSISLAVGNLR